MRAFAVAFFVVFAFGFASALAFEALGAWAGLAATGASIVIILLMSVGGALITGPRPPESVMLAEGAHWSVYDGVRYPDGFSDFFHALVDIAHPDSFLALADGVWDREIRDMLTSTRVDLGDAVPPLALDFATAIADQGGRIAIVPITRQRMEILAKLADHHASVEIAMHLSAFTRDGPWLEVFDAFSQPIAISIDLPEESVAKFADAIGAKWMACRWTDPSFTQRTKAE